METVADGNNEHLQLVQGGAHPAGTELPDLLRRERADFLNYKRRVELERTLDREQASAALIAKVLPLLDEQTGPRLAFVGEHGATNSRWLGRAPRPALRLPS
jgi:hypothetical protein